MDVAFSWWWCCLQKSVFENEGCCGPVCVHSRYQITVILLKAVISFLFLGNLTDEPHSCSPSQTGIGARYQKRSPGKMVFIDVAQVPNILGLLCGAQ